MADNDTGQEPKSNDPEIPPDHPAIKAAVENALKAAEANHREREGALIKYKDELESTKAALKEQGLSGNLIHKPDELGAMLKRLEELETKQAAGEAGMDPEEFSEAVEKAAQAKYAARQQELDELQRKRQEKIDQLEAENQKLQHEIHRSFVAQELMRATTPGDVKIIHDGAWDNVVNTLSGMVVEHEIQGLDRPVARFKVGGSLVPAGSLAETPDGLMDMREWVELTRQGKGPTGHLSYCFISNGQGTGTRTTSRTSASAPTNWWKMTEEQRTAFVDKEGAGAARELIDKSGPRPKETATA